MSVFSKQLNVLVISDNPEEKSFIKECISEELLSHSIFYVSTVAEMKVKLLTHIVFDIILFNMDHADEDGEERVRKVLNGASGVPVIVLACSEDKYLSFKSVSLGVADYLFKNELNTSLLTKSIIYSIERRKFNLSLRESERRYKELFHLNPVPMWVYEINSLQFLDVNQAAIRHYGYSKEEFLNMNILDIRPKESISEVLNKVQTYKSEGESIKSIAKHHKKNGELIHVEIEGNTIDFANKKARLVLATDITEKLKAENNLKISEQRFKALVQEGADLITIINKEERFQYVSPNHRTILGYNPDMLLSEKVRDFIHENDADRVLKVALGLNLQGSVNIAPYRVKHANGKWVWLETTITNLLLDTAIRGVVSNSRDVSERIDNEKKIKETNARYEAVAQATNDAIWDCDLRTGQTFISGDGYLKLFGYSIVNDYLEADFWEKRIHPEDTERIMNLTQHAFAAGDTQFASEYRFLKADGDYAYVFERSFIVYDEGHPIRIYGSMQNITTRKYHERILEIEREIYALNATTGVSLEFILEKLIDEIESLIPRSLCSIVQLKDDKSMYHIAGDSLPREYTMSTDGILIGPEIGSCGTAIYTGEPVIVSDIENDKLWRNYKMMAARYNLKACWSVPIKKSDGTVVGSFATYYHTTKSPKKHEINFVERAANLVGVLIENREASEKLKRSNERYGIVIKATSDTIWDWDISKDRITYNRGIHTVFGYPIGYIQVDNVRDWWTNIIHPEDLEKMQHMLNNVLEKKQSNLNLQTEYRFRCADGSYKYVFDRVFIILDETYNPVRMIGAMQDITRQKEEEHRLRLLESVITNTTDAVIITDADHSDQSEQKVVYVNDAFTNMTGYKREEVIGRKSRILQGRNTNRSDLEKLATAIRQWEHCEIELISYRKNGEEFWMNISVAPVADETGTFTHWIAIQRDVTERKTREIEREQLILELNLINKDLKQFSYITSHNFKAPLSNLIGFLNIIDEIPIENPMLAQIIQGFRVSTNLLNDTINDLVKILIIRDKGALEKKETSFDKITKQVISQVENLIAESEAEIVTDYGHAPVVIFNETYLESILLNLITNAIKYRSYSRALKIDINTKNAGDFVILTFEDNGIGIDLKRNRKKIFGLYQKFHDRPNSKGMGLYLIKSQLESLGGSIDVESNVDVGTKFILKFKVKNDKQAALR